MKTIPMDKPESWSGSVIDHRGRSVAESYVKVRNYYNTAPKSFVIIDRQNVRITILPEKWNLGPVIAQNSLIIREQISCNSANKESISIQARMTGESLHSPVHTAALEDWQSTRRLDLNSDLKYQNTVLADLVVSEGGAVYIAEYDIVVVYGANAMAHAVTLEHPYSITKQTRNSYDRVKDTMDHCAGDFTFNVRIVDNSGSIGERWIKIGKEICRIGPCEDPTVMDGFYVTTRKYAKVGFGDELGLISERIPYYSESEIPFFKLYRSRIDALNAPSDQAELEYKTKLIDAEIKANELAGKLLLSENALLKLEKEKEQLEKSMAFNQAKYLSDLETLAKEKDVLLAKQHTEHIKAKNEAHAAERKNISEFIKYVPIVLTSVAALAGVFVKAK